MNRGRLCQIILKSHKEISGYGQLAQHAIFAYHMVRQTSLIALPPLRFPDTDRSSIAPEGGGHSWNFDEVVPPVTSKVDPVIECGDG